jgi:uncharacterized pyridoxamine 5'-phosphate oxidase family protein
VELDEICTDMIANGNIPIDTEDNQDYLIQVEGEVESTDMAIKVVEIMINKYYDLLDFYNENTKPEKIIKAKKELQ